MSDFKLGDECWVIVLVSITDNLLYTIRNLDVKKGRVNDIANFSSRMRIKLDKFYTDIEGHHLNMEWGHKDETVFKTEKEAWEMVCEILAENLMKQLSLMPEYIRDNFFNYKGKQ